MARNHKAGGQGEPHAARMGELLPSRHRQQGVSGTRQLRSDAVAPVVAVQAQNQASQGRDLFTLASLRALWARTPEQAWARRAVGEGVKCCPRAGCGKSARSRNDCSATLWKRVAAQFCRRVQSTSGGVEPEVDVTSRRAQGEAAAGTRYR